MEAGLTDEAIRFLVERRHDPYSGPPAELRRAVNNESKQEQGERP
jgi:hypothetical protein